MIKDYYYLLRLPRGAPLTEIKKAYRQLAGQYHPDKVAGMDSKVQEEAAAKMRELNEAIAVLSDPERRGEYDQMVELIPERKPKVRDERRFSRASAPAVEPAQEKTRGSGREPSSRAVEQEELAHPDRALTSPRQPEPQPAPAAEPSPGPKAAAPPGMLAEEFARKRQLALRKLPLSWKELSVRGWQWALEGGSWRRRIVVVHRHLETLSLLSFRSLQTALEGLMNRHKLSLRPTTVIVLVSYERLMDAKPIQEHLQGLVSSEHGVLGKVRPLLVLYDGKRASVVGLAPDEPGVQRIIRVLLGR